VGSDREVRIRNRHSRQFYSFADKLLRSEVELERLRNGPLVDGSAVAELESKVSDFRAGLTATAHEAEA
jgi:anaerobic magnesium-protoporphyrin IX monomethyl ester cyclase